VLLEPECRLIGGFSLVLDQVLLLLEFLSVD
jgi:hypothetical protein